MAKKKMITVKITGPRCKWDDRKIYPGEIVTVPAELAREWIDDGRALDMTSVEVTSDDRKND